jgi:homoserine O-acetyltransferase
MPAGDRPSIANGSTSSVWGYSSLEDFLVAYWENFFLPKDANNLLTILWTWQHGDISDNELYRGDFKKALGAIKAKAYVMREQTDLYFAPEDGQFESPTCRMRNFCPSRRFGAISAGGPGTNPYDVKFLDTALKELLAW